VQETHRGHFMCTLFLFDLTIKFGKSPPLFSAHRKLVTALSDSELDVLPCGRVHCAGEEIEQST
jgi:hypothetical protein